MSQKKLMTLIVAAVIAASSTSASAQQAEPGEAVESSLLLDVGEFVVPEGDLDEVIEYVEELSELQAELDRQYNAAQSKINGALRDASEKVLASDEEISDRHFMLAAKMVLPERIRGVRDASKEEQKKLLELTKRQLRLILEEGEARPNIANAMGLATYLERGGDPEVALEANQAFADMIRESGNTQLRPYQSRFESTAKRLALLGKEIEIEGSLVDGEEFDWSQYRGKVVLVDFWATWCGPCIAEAPNVRKNYDLYHEKGFDVVGISLDSDRERLEAYVEKESVPWVNLFKEGAGWKHPMAVKYGINAIPSVWLVDKEGKVVSLSARGDELGRQLEQLLGPVEEDEAGADEQEGDEEA
ncbi:peroxiredoxin family protein [Roseiconus lacunae]|uniref:TlpA disulfide reductase family protein n=1 Tax=Roseiconus lacunae TaxID=2605694 RepID=A0ABT7PD74_9BACT|nr:TlpA disulfide reductase family protein [Roseiconus lacunae]MDM4014433.1 TlpA disulfide reductase family protein [Roseiconus lacunae]